MAGSEATECHWRALNRKGIAISPTPTGPTGDSPLAQRLKLSTASGSSVSVTPTVSLVIPAYNEEDSIVRLLESIVAQRTQPTEAILVDAGSTDRTVQLAEAFAGRLPLRILRRERLNPGEARNAGAAEAGCDWIAFTDAGIELDPSWLSALCAEMTSDAEVVLGSYDPSCPTWFARAAALAYVPARSEGGIRGPAVPSMAIRRDLFRSLPGFPPHRAAEDLMFFDMLRARRAIMRHAPGAIARWELAPTFGSTFRRFASYSQINLRAGYGRHWHLGLLRQYAVVCAAAILLSALASPWLALVILPFWFLARALRAGWHKRGDLPFDTLRPSTLFEAAVVLLVIDVATWVGTYRYWRARHL